MFVGRSSAVASTKWSRKPGPIRLPKAASPSLAAPSTKLIAAIRVLAVFADVVADHEGAVGPADEHGLLEVELVGDRADVVGPKCAVGVVLRLEWRLGHAVTT